MSSKDPLICSGVTLTAFHPQTDRQTKHLNQTIEAYLRVFVSHEQNNWVALLLIAEFSNNNSVTMGNGLSPFYANYRFHPVASDSTASGPLNPVSKVNAHWIHTVHEESTKSLEAIQERMHRYTDPKRTKPPKYQVGNLVMLNRRNIKTCQP